MEKKLLFALDIGTRSVVGLVGEQTEGGIRLITTERQEHNTRAMLDGQIHDVPEVAAVLADIKARLEQSCGPLKEVAVAAAGRALCTITSTAEMEVCGLLTAADERSLELAAIQAAQHQLATSNAVADPTMYFCVGYSTIGFTLDSTPLKTIIGQRGKLASIQVIATFLPRQVIDSMQSALHKADLKMAALTLEPIAAINVLIPPSMRHLNLALVDIGAGTSDVAITRDGCVIGYGMVPCAGDEITEAISQKYLLDFNVAEKVKRQLNGKPKKLSFTDVLGIAQKVSVKEINHAIATTVAELAQAIAAQILALNNLPPQAVLLVGGGSLTPMLPDALAQALDIPSSRVAVRKPDVIDGLEGVTDSLRTPDSVTPLGILKLSTNRSLNFVNVTLNGQALHLFNLGNLTVADAVLAAGIDIRSLNGRPGLGMTVKINGQTKFIPGSLGKPGNIQLNGQAASYTDPLNEGDSLVVIKGADGTAPDVKLSEVISTPELLAVTINDKLFQIPPAITINDIPATADTPLSDRDQIVCLLPNRLAEIAKAAGLITKPKDYIYTINGTKRMYSVPQTYTVNGCAAADSNVIETNDNIIIKAPSAPSLAEVLGLTNLVAKGITILFNKSHCLIPFRRYTFTVNGQPATADDTVADGSTIDFTYFEQPHPMISDVLLAAEFNPRDIPPSSKVAILLNGQPAEYTAPVKNGDAIDIVIK